MYTICGGLKLDPRGLKVSHPLILHMILFFNISIHRFPCLFFGRNEYGGVLWGVLYWDIFGGLQWYSPKQTTLNPRSISTKASNIVKLVPIFIGQTLATWGLECTPYSVWPPTYCFLSLWKIKRFCNRTSSCFWTWKGHHNTIHEWKHQFLHCKRTCLLHRLQHINFGGAQGTSNVPHTLVCIWLYNQSSRVESTLDRSF